MPRFIKAGTWRINLSLVTEFEIVSDEEVIVVFVAAWGTPDGTNNCSAHKLYGEEAREFLRGVEAS
jgi:hypothetical protein